MIQDTYTPRPEHKFTLDYEPLAIAGAIHLTMQRAPA
jgi:hypothetical protein